MLHAHNHSCKSEMVATDKATCHSVRRPDTCRLFLLVHCKFMQSCNSKYTYYQVYQLTSDHSMSRPASEYPNMSLEPHCDQHHCQWWSLIHEWSYCTVFHVGDRVITVTDDDLIYDVKVLLTVEIPQLSLIQLKTMCVQIQTFVAVFRVAASSFRPSGDVPQTR